MITRGLGKNSKIVTRGMGPSLFTRVVAVLRNSIYVLRSTATTLFRKTTHITRKIK